MSDPLQYPNAGRRPLTPQDQTQMPEGLPEIQGRQPVPAPQPPAQPQAVAPAVQAFPAPPHPGYGPVQPQAPGPYGQPGFAQQPYSQQSYAHPPVHPQTPVHPQAYAQPPVHMQPFPAYGAPSPYGPYPHYLAVYPQSNGMASAALTLGLLAIFLVWIPLFLGAILGWILGILAITFGGVGISRANKGAGRQGQAVAGLVLGILTIGLTFFGVGILI